MYANAWFGRLHDCLREDFPALAHALGADAFHDLVKTYLMAHPPSRPSLRDAGAHLAGHLETAPFAEIFARRCVHAADLARLEWALVEAFDAADAPVLAPATLAALPADAWEMLRFAPAPSLRLLGCAWPVHEAREQIDREPGETCPPGPPSLQARPTAICVWRCDERVRYRALEPLEAEALAALAAGAPYGEVCERVADAVGSAAAAGTAAALLARWISAGMLVDPRDETVV